MWIHKDSSLCRSFDHREHGLTWWPIKSNIQQPLLSFTVTFDINHSHQGSAVRFQAAGLLWSLPRTPQQNRPLYITASLGGLLLDTRASLPERKKKYLQAVIPLAVSLTAFHSLRAATGQKLRVGSFCGKREKIMLTLESQLFLFITRVRGPVIFIGRMADSLILTVHFWLWC